MANGADHLVCDVPANMTILAVKGVAVAGRLGMTINLMTAVTSITGTWVTVRTPEFGGYVAKKD